MNQRAWFYKFLSDKMYSYNFMGYKYTFQKAYFAGGTTTTNVNTIDALVFSSETDSALSAVLSSARYTLAGANSGGIL